jgi:hypothetical protein
MRALELARAGSCRTIDDIRRHLRSEGYRQVEEYLDGASLRKQLNYLMREAHKVQQNKPEQ